jgi:hypothetical protein
MSGQRCTDEFKEGLSPSPRTRHPTNSKREPGPFSIRPTFSTCRLPFALQEGTARMFDSVTASTTTDCGNTIPGP